MIAILTASVFGQPAQAEAASGAPTPPPAVAVDFGATPVWAARAALADLQSLPPVQQPLTRYVWARGGTAGELATISYTVNAALSRVNIGMMPGLPGTPGAGAMTLLHGGKLVRLDLNLIATDPDDLVNLVETWEKLAKVETDFTVEVEFREIVKLDKPLKQNGKTFHTQWKVTQLEGPAAHVSAEVTAMGLLMNPAAAVSADGVQPLGLPISVPIIDARELNETALSTLEGGLYYEFRGIKSGTTLKDYLLSRGASEEQVAKLESLEKAVQLRSKITGKERMVSLFRGAGVRASTGGGLVSITFDQFDEDRSTNDSPIRNLVNFKGRGFEVIVELANGFHEWTLWNENRILVRVAPPNLASDHTIPEPYTRNLQPGISCIRCHGNEDGWRGFTNDVPRILAAGPDIFGDLSAPGDLAKQQQLIAGLYGGDWFQPGIGPFAVGRLTYDRAVFRATGKPINEVSNLLSEQWNGYAYSDLDAWAVARELGIVNLPPSDDNPETEGDLTLATATLREFIGVIPAGGGVVAREDFVIAAICAGLPVSRRSWETCKHIALERAYQRGIQ
jgi:hypothetical protein